MMVEVEEVGGMVGVVVLVVMDQEVVDLVTLFVVREMLCIK